MALWLHITYKPYSCSGESFVLSYPPDTDDSTKQLLSLAWHSEFLPIANGLFTRLQTHSTQLEPLSPKDYHMSDR